MRVLGIDPGKRQSWYALLHEQSVRCRGGERRSWDLVDTGHLDLDPDTALNDRLDGMAERIHELVTRIHPDLLVAERFISRPGRGMGNSAEIINLALGMIYLECRALGIPTYFVMPSVHKQWFAKNFIRRPEQWWPINGHQGDACAMAIYGRDRLA